MLAGGHRGGGDLGVEPDVYLCALCEQEWEAVGPGVSSELSDDPGGGLCICTELIPSLVQQKPATL